MTNTIGKMQKKWFLNQICQEIVLILTYLFHILDTFFLNNSKKGPFFTFLANNWYIKYISNLKEICLKANKIPPKCNF